MSTYLLRRVLTAAGMTVFEQASAIGATRSIRNNGIDIVLVDVTMPGLSGDKLVALLRHNPRFRRLIIVVVSAEDMGELEVLVGPDGANAVVPRDRVEHELVHVLTRIWTRTRRSSAEHLVRTNRSGFRSLLHGDSSPTSYSRAEGILTEPPGPRRPSDRGSRATQSSGEHRIVGARVKRYAR